MFALLSYTRVALWVEYIYKCMGFFFVVRVQLHVRRPSGQPDYMFSYSSDALRPQISDWTNFRATVLGVFSIRQPENYRTFAGRSRMRHRMTSHAKWRQYKQLRFHLISRACCPKESHYSATCNRTKPSGGRCGWKKSMMRKVLLVGIQRHNSSRAPSLPVPATRQNHRRQRTHAISVLAVAESYLKVGGICCLVL